MNAARAKNVRRRGFTLMEILLVLAILVAVAALALPALRGPLANQQLRRTADLLRTEWNTARNRAMKTGKTYVFLYQPGGQNYQLQAWTGDEAEKQTADGFGEGQTAPPAAASARQLPADVTFHAGDSTTDARAAAVEQQLAGGGGWARPILFYADGSSSTARVVLVNPRQHYIVATLRGLTGMTQVSDILDASELPP